MKQPTNDTAERVLVDDCVMRIASEPPERILVDGRVMQVTPSLLPWRLDLYDRTGKLRISSDFCPSVVPPDGTPNNAAFQDAARVVSMISKRAKLFSEELNRFRDGTFDWLAVEDGRKESSYSTVMPGPEWPESKDYVKLTVYRSAYFEKGRRYRYHAHLNDRFGTELADAVFYLKSDGPSPELSAVQRGAFAAMVKALRPVARLKDVIERSRKESLI